jgi:3-oxoadipate enol-lactonase / 4-carboxymuconolactone decarboxylase
MTVALHHRIDGPAGAPVVAFATSLGTALAMWDDQAAALAGRFRVLRFDHRGHGRSPVPPGPYTVEEMTGDVVALLDRLGIERLSYCGLSLGGMVGMRLALDHPERIERLVVCCTSAHLGPPEMWRERAATAREHGVGPLVAAALERWFTPDAPPAMVAKLEAMLRATDPEGYAGGCEALASTDLRGQLGAIRAPTLAIAGADDPAAPPFHLEAIRDEIPGARLHVIERARHIANVERADEFNRALLGFLDDGTRTRRDVLGDAHVDAAIARTTEFTADFQDLITRYAWGEIWSRPGLDRRTRSAITLTALVARGHDEELVMHLRGALRNGLSADEIKEVLLQAAIYCGVPAANSAFAIAQRVLDEEIK